MERIINYFLDYFLSNSNLVDKYNMTIDRKSAAEILAKKL